MNYEGQAAIELEQLAEPGETGCYPARITAGPPLRISGASLIEAALGDLARGAGLPVISARFHNGVADAITRACALLASAHDLDTVALSGGVFQNLLLTDRVADQLSAAGLRVLTHHRVPCNDGGISLGQAAAVAARDLLATG